MIKENCVCGATFEVSYADRNEENDVWARCSEKDRYNEFLEAHKICRNSDAKQKLDAQPVTLINAEDSKRIADNIIEQINTLAYQMQMDFTNMTFNISNSVTNRG